MKVYDKSARKDFALRKNAIPIIEVDNLPPHTRDFSRELGGSA